MKRRRRGKAPSKAAKRRAARQNQAAFIDEMLRLASADGRGAVFIELGPSGLRIEHEPMESQPTRTAH